MDADGTVRTLLRGRGAETVAHPGGTLYAHLVRVHDRLAELGLSGRVRLAGLVHAAYGTDGFDVVLLDLSERDMLRRLVGDEAEALVYRYGACDRRRTWRDLAGTHKLWDRFTAQVQQLSVDDLRPLVDLSIVNELDVIEHAPAVADRYGDYFRTVFNSWAGLASAPVIAEARRILAF